jgi:hypothetical protein
MRQMLIIIIGLTFISLPGRSFSETSTSLWKCGDTHIIRVGDSQASVNAQCGEPTYTNEKKSAYIGTPKKRQSKNRTTGSYQKKNVNTETWFYNCGPDDFNASLLFQGGELKKITLGDYGSGESYCTGIENNPKTKKDQQPNTSKNVK